jgi:NCS2 family nucleobase:cation symporter-2
MPRPVLGGVFVLVCGMIIVSGIKLIHAAKNTTANALLIGTTLVCAICVPVYTQILQTTKVGAAWLGSLPSVVKLLMTNTVVLAVVMGIVLNLLLNIVMNGENSDS